MTSMLRSIQSSASQMALALVLTALVVTPGSIALAADYKLTGENTTIGFVGTKKDGSHAGGFKQLSGTFAAPADITKGKISVTIVMDSCWSDDEKLTGHLKAPDFFEVKRYPEAKFVSTAIAKTADGYSITGDLTLHGKTNSIVFPAQIKQTDSGVELTSKFNLPRSQWGITYGAGKIDENVQMSLAIKAK
ncbi:MAG: YceI family protein [Planctomyces sp.]|nr:YceI family protein [Planctomyces sp.]